MKYKKYGNLEETNEIKKLDFGFLCIFNYCWAINEIIILIITFLEMHFLYQKNNKNGIEHKY